MKGDGEGGSEGAHENDYGKANNEIKVTRHKFVKTTAAFGAAVAGSPYNLTDITNIFLKEDGELIMYPSVNEYKWIESTKKLPFEFERCVNIHCWGCNWNCKWCSMKFSIFKDMTPIIMSIDNLMYLLISLENKKRIRKTLCSISGGEPLLQKEEVLKLIESLKMKTNYTVVLSTNGSLLDEYFIDKANDLGLDGINISFRRLDGEWHKQYTDGAGIKSTIDALKLISKKFKGGLQMVSLIAWPELDTEMLEKMFKFLHEINPSFLIKIFRSRYPTLQEEEWKRRYFEAKTIAWRYGLRVDQTGEFYQIKSKRYLIKEDENGKVELIKGENG